MGILLVYDVSDESSFNNIKNWMKNIEQHASENVIKVLVGNKSDLGEGRRAVPTARAQALADEHKMLFFEASAKSGTNVENVFGSVPKCIVHGQGGTLIQQLKELVLSIKMSGM